MMRLKIFFALFVFIASGVFIQAKAQHLDNTKRWSITLPLRFTHLQGSNTMLSGVKLGRGFNDHLNEKTSLGFGLAYRPMLSSGQISYSSNITSGSIPIDNQFPNGLNLILSIKGIL